MTNNKYLAIFAALAAVFLAGNVRAAGEQAYLSGFSRAAVGEEFRVKVLIDSDLDSNAYYFEITYPPELRLTGFDLSGSVVEVWQEQPSEIKPGLVRFAGGRTSPFRGRGEILTLIFRSGQEGSIDLDFAAADIFLADGKGTKSESQKTGLSMLVSGTAIAGDSTSSLYADATPPEIRTITLTPDPFDGSQKILGFLAVDGGSGVKETLIRTKSWLFWDDWFSEQSPVAVPDSVWAASLLVKDANGNISEKTIYDWKYFGFMLAKLLGMAAVIFMAVYVLKRTKTKRFQGMGS